jgi:hypothetical protein
LWKEKGAFMSVLTGPTVAINWSMALKELLVSDGKAVSGTSIELRGIHHKICAGVFGGERRQFWA